MSQRRKGGNRNLGPAPRSRPAASDLRQPSRSGQAEQAWADPKIRL